MKKLGIVRFPGSNCDRDAFQMAKAKGYDPEFLWHLDRFDTQEYEALILPGGFSYGDYLRAGALSARSPVMDSVREFASKGKPILGVCNGFQVLTESGLLPGALVKNQGLRFIDEFVRLKVVNKNPHFAKTANEEIRLPIAHGEGRFFASEDLLKQIQDQGQIWLRYLENPNGSMLDIAGVQNKAGNVAALMPHPERALYDWMGSADGWSFI